jgi:hypothetical protein
MSENEIVKPRDLTPIEARIIDSRYLAIPKGMTPVYAHRVERW